MGYYSIYKIIKDLIFTFISFFKRLSKKTLTIIIIFILVFLLFSFKNKTEAHTSYYNLINTYLYNTYGIAENSRAWAVWQNDNGVFFTFSPDSHLLSSDGGYICFSNEYRQNRYQAQKFFSIDSNNNITYLTDTIFYNVTNYSRCTSSMLLDINKDIIWLNNYPTVLYSVSDFEEQNPYIINTNTEIQNWSFNNLEINGGSISPYFELNDSSYPYSFSLSINYNGTAYIIDITDYTTINENTKTFSCSIPRLAISSLFNFNLNSDLAFRLVLTPFNENGDYTTPTSYNLDSYTFSLAQNDIDTINQDSLRYKITENSNTINNINTSINNNNISSNSTNDFSNIDNNLTINDNTSINTIFDNIYNAFTTKYNDNNIGYGYTLSLPIPFTDKTIDISPHTVFGRDWADLYQDENKYNYPGVQTIYRFVQTIWWFVIGLFILKDIRGMINKIAEGNIEDISSDVKKELL